MSELKKSLQAIISLDFDLECFDEKVLTKNYIEKVLKEKLHARYGLNINVLDILENKHIFE